MKQSFIDKGNLKHNNKYDYSLVEYVNSRTPVTIICPEHGPFDQTPSNHLQRGCGKCNEEAKAKSYSLGLETFIAKSIAVHGDKYDYSQVVYQNNTTPVTIICPIHGPFSQLPKTHLRGAGCRECGIELLKESLSSSTEEFVEKAIAIHGDRYDYSQVVYKGSTLPITIICPVHGPFQQTPNSHLVGKGCAKCQISHGERDIASYLVDLGIEFTTEKTFMGLTFKGALRYDFFIPGMNLLIEFDGEQHFRPVKFGGMSAEKAQVNFDNTVLRDQIKNQYAEEMDITLIRISFKDDLLQKLNTIFN